jgi:hypothetical protein
MFTPVGCTGRGFYLNRFSKACRGFAVSTCRIGPWPWSSGSNLPVPAESVLDELRKIPQPDQCSCVFGGQYRAGALAVDFAVLRKRGGLGSRRLNKLTQAALSSRHQSPRSSAHHPAETLQVCGLRAHPLYGEFGTVFRLARCRHFSARIVSQRRSLGRGKKWNSLSCYFSASSPSGWVEGINLPASQTACEKLTASIPTDARYREHLHCIVKVDGNANYSFDHSRENGACSASVFRCPHFWQVGRSAFVMAFHPPLGRRWMIICFSGNPEFRETRSQEKIGKDSPPVCRMRAGAGLSQGVGTFPIFPGFGGWDSN